ncbi:MAG TPA: hypothetical protein PLD47_08565 [Aggregatilineales bacterium]|nr:hypothetical protein [Anaerolineales bacterium]HRE47764.1 hypothetical protein [Aggregatilineales bacterium]
MQPTGIYQKNDYPDTQAWRDWNTFEAPWGNSGTASGVASIVYDPADPHAFIPRKPIVALTAIYPRTSLTNMMWWITFTCNADGSISPVKLTYCPTMPCAVPPKP